MACYVTDSHCTFLVRSANLEKAYTTPVLISLNTNIDIFYVCGIFYRCDIECFRLLELVNSYELVRDGTAKIEWLRVSPTGTLVDLTKLWSQGDLQGLFGVTGRCLTKLELAAGTNWNIPAFTNVCRVTEYTMYKLEFVHVHHTYQDENLFFTTKNLRHLMQNFESSLPYI